MSSARLPKERPGYTTDSIFQNRNRARPGIVSNPMTPSLVRSAMKSPGTVRHMHQMSELPPSLGFSPEQRKLSAALDSERSHSTTQKRFASIEDIQLRFPQQSPGITELLEEHRPDSSYATSRQATPFRSLFESTAEMKTSASFFQRELSGFAIAMSFCFLHTPGFAEALTQRKPGTLTNAMAGICSTKQREVWNEQTSVFLTAINGEKAGDIKYLLEVVLRKLNSENESISAFQELTEVAEVISITHKLACNRSNVKSKKPRMYLKVNCSSQLECIAKQLFDKYEPMESREKCSLCKIPGGKIYRQRKIMRIGQILLVLANRKQSETLGECFPSHQISLKVSSGSTGKQSELRFFLNAALSYESRRHSFTGYYSINNKWHLVDEDSMCSIAPAEIEKKQCFLFFFTRVNDESPFHELDFDSLTAMRLPGSFYIPTLCALVLAKKFLKMCFAHRREGLESLPGMIGEILENASIKNPSSIVFDRVWKRYFLPMAPQISTPSEFLKHFFDVITQQDERRTDKLFDAKFQMIRQCKVCCTRVSRMLCEKLVHLPITEIRDISAIPEDFLREFNLTANKGPLQLQLKLKEKNIMRYLALKLKPMHREIKMGLMFCRGFSHKQYIEGKKLKETGALLVFDFYIDNKAIVKTQATNLRVETVLEVQQLGSDIIKTYNLKAVIKGANVNSAYLMIDGAWYLLTEDAIKKIDHLPVYVPDAQVVIYEIVGAKNEALSFSPIFPGPSARIADVFQYLRRRVQRERNISRIKQFLRLKSVFKLWTSGAVLNPPPRFIAPLRGLPNLAYSCYFSAVLNCLYYSTDFSNVVKRLLSSASTELTSALSYFFRHYQSPQVDLRNTITTILKQMGFEKVAPNDPHLFFLMLLKKLTCVVSNDLSWKLKELFEIKERPSRIACVRCQGEPCSVPKSLVLTVSKPEETDLGSLISTLYNSCCETGHLCKECRRLLPCPRLVSVGAILPIFLEYSDPRLLHRVAVSCPATLDMNVWAAFSGKYELYGAVKMRGQAASRHVVATIKINANWWCFDDETVEPFDEFEEVEGSPYLLFYEKAQVSLKTHIPPFKGLGLQSNRLIFSVLTALFYSPKLFAFLKSQDFSELAGVSRSIGDFFKSFQREPLSEAVTFDLQSLDINNMDPVSVFAFVIQSLVRDVQNDEDIFHRNTEVKKALNIHFSGKCAGLHKMCAVLTEIQNVCRSCFSSNARQWLEFSQVLKMQVPRRLEDTKDGTLFGGGEAYHRSISSKYKTQNAKNLKDYCDALKDFLRVQRYDPEPEEISAVDLYTCFRYKSRLGSNQATLRCKQCQDERPHFTQQFIRFLGAVLVIEIARIEEESRVAFNREVAFPYQLDLSEIVEGVSLYELKSFLCKGPGGAYAVTVNLSGNWYTFQGGEVKPANPGANFYENACVLVYEQAR